MSIPIHGKNLGFKVNGTAIPDPSKFEYTVASLDTSAARNAKGNLYRNMVATKYNLSLEFTLEWDESIRVLGLLTAASFQLTWPLLERGGPYTGKYYSGDRKVGAIRMPADETTKYTDEWVVTLAFNLIEY